MVPEIAMRYGNSSLSIFDPEKKAFIEKNPLYLGPLGNGNNTFDNSLIA